MSLSWRPFVLLCLAALVCPERAVAAEPIGATRTRIVNAEGVSFTRIDLVARSDQPITISSVRVNRGNCFSWTLGPDVPSTTLRFGQTLSAIAPAECEVIEVSVLTDQGEITVRW